MNVIGGSANDQVTVAAAAKADPVDFRLRHLEDPRAMEVIRTAAEKFGWTTWRRERDRGGGFAFARYKNLAAYCAVAMDVEVERETGLVRVGRIVAAVDSGDAVNPDGTTQGKAQFLADLKSGKFKLESNQLDDMKVHAADADMAIVTYRSTDKGSYDGHDLSGQYRWLDVFAKRGGTWQFIVSQGTKLEPAKKP